MTIVDKNISTCHVQLTFTPEIDVRIEPTVIGVTAKKATLKWCKNVLVLSTRKKNAAILKNEILNVSNITVINNFGIKNCKKKNREYL
jgi:hypothetical protein